MLKVISVAAMLSFGVFVNASATLNVQLFNAPQQEMAEMLSADQEQMKPKSERRLIEEHAAPNWGLTIEEAWYQYNSGMIVIIEIEEDQIYEVEYTGDIMLVVWEEQ